MSSESDSSYSHYSDSNETPTLYRDNPDFADLEPLPIPQAEDEPYFIVHSEEYEDLFGYFFALVKKDEISQRCLDVCNKIIENYPFHYTAWSMKFKCLEKLGFDYDTESQMQLELFKCNPKSYQNWYFKMWLIDHSTEFHDDIPFLVTVLNDDPKNFHAWSFALYFADKWGKHQDIYDIAKEKIRFDARNNSAWNARMAMANVLNIPAKQEFEDAAKTFQVISKNEAAMNFIFGLVKKDPSLIEDLKQLGNTLLEKNPENVVALHIQLFIATFQQEDRDVIQRTCDQLIKVDPIRINYYNLLKEGTIKYQ